MPANINIYKHFGISAWDIVNIQKKVFWFCKSFHNQYRFILICIFYLNSYFIINTKTLVVCNFFFGSDKKVIYLGICCLNELYSDLGSYSIPQNWIYGILRVSYIPPLRNTDLCVLMWILTLVRKYYMEYLLQCFLCIQNILINTNNSYKWKCSFLCHMFNRLALIWKCWEYMSAPSNL